MEKGEELLQAAHAGDVVKLNQLIDAGVDVAYQVRFQEAIRFYDCLHGLLAKLCAPHDDLSLSTAFHAGLYNPAGSCNWDVRTDESRR